ncbi:MAG: FAD-dependent thymidylate synthase [Clostridiales bacterium]|nr:FAD-dependent thymidylate synthase [Clostridiales bacterium]
MPEVTPNVKLIRYTPAPEELIAMAGKLCYSAADLDDLGEGVAERDQTKYLSRLSEMGHYSTFEHASFTFGIEGVSRSLLAQITRHRIASFSVQSQRYVALGDDENGFDYVVPPRIAALGEEAEAEYHAQMAQMNAWYQAWRKRLGTGEASNEDARFVLPNAAATRMLVTMNARELLHFLSLRCCNRAQWEIRSVAWQMLALAYEAAPALFGKAGPGCLRGACPEGRKCCGHSDEVRARFEEIKNAKR